MEANKKLNENDEVLTCKKTIEILLGLPTYH